MIVAGQQQQVQNQTNKEAMKDKATMVQVQHKAKNIVQYITKAN